MYTFEFEDLVAQGMEWEDYQALLRDLANEEIFLTPEYAEFCAEIDGEIDLDEMAKYYGEA